MKTVWKKLLSIFICSALCLSIIPITAFAAVTDLQIKYHSDDQTITWDAFPNAISYTVGIRNPGSNVNLFTVKSDDEQLDMEEILSEEISTYGVITHTTAPGTNVGFYANPLTNDYGIKGSYDICITVTYKVQDSFGHDALKTESTTVSRVKFDYVLENGYPGNVDGIRIVRDSSNHPILTWESNHHEGGVMKRFSYKVTVSFVNVGNTYYFNGSGVTPSEYTILSTTNKIDLSKLESELSSRGIQNSKLSVRVEAELSDIYYYKYATSSTADVYLTNTVSNPYSVVYWSDGTAKSFSVTYNLNGMDHSPNFTQYNYKISLMKTVSATNRTAVYTVNASSSEPKKTMDLSAKVSLGGSALYSVLIQEIYKSGSHAGEEHAAYETWKRSFDVTTAKPLSNPTPDLDPNGKLKWQPILHANGYHIVLKDNSSNTLAELDTKETKYDFSSYMTNNGVYRCYVTAFDTTGTYAKSAESRTEWTTYTVYKFLGIYVYGVPVTEANRYDVLGDGSVKFLPDGRSYYDYLGSETLVLKNVNFTKSRYHRDGAGNKAVIYIDNDIAIHLIGDNVINVDWEEDLDGIFIAPYDFINFYSDSGSLTVNVSRNGGRAIAAPGSCVSLWENASLDLTGHYGFYSDSAGDIGTLNLFDNSELTAYGLRTDDDKEGYAIETPYLGLADNSHLRAEYEWNQPCMYTWSRSYWLYSSTVLKFRGIKDILGTINRTWTDVKEINGSNVSEYRAVDILAVTEKHYTVSGTVTSFGTNSDTVTLKLTKEGQSTPAYTVNVTGCNTNYSFADVAPGTYTLTVSKSKHCTREYTVKVGTSNVTKNCSVLLRGDADGNGKVNSSDRVLLSRYLANWDMKDNTEYIPYSDVDNDGKITQIDRIILSRYLAGWSEYNKYFG